MKTSSMSDTMVEIHNLHKSFGETQVLRGISLKIQAGEIFALLGSNGAGKTTLINILSTLLKADSGNATVNGFDVNKQAEQVRSSISLTGQFAAVDDILTGRENLELMAKLRNVAEPSKVADDLLQQFRLVEAANRRCSTYSGGMTRRLDIAMSLIGTPAAIFLDEPTTGLDPEARLEVWRTIKELSGAGTTILLTTQNLEEAELLADRVAILHRGKIIANGTLAQLKKLLPPVKQEYVKKQPTLEEIYFALTGSEEAQ